MRTAWTRDSVVLHKCRSGVEDVALDEDQKGLIIILGALSFSAQEMGPYDVGISAFRLICHVGIAYLCRMQPQSG
jgi:hypothetical protein